MFIKTEIDTASFKLNTKNVKLYINFHMKLQITVPEFRISESKRSKSRVEASQETTVQTSRHTSSLEICKIWTRLKSFMLIILMKFDLIHVFLEDNF